MTKKFRENFFILLSSNICTIIMVTVIPNVLNDKFTSNVKSDILSNITSLSGITYCICCIMLICIIYAFIKFPNRSEIVINNNVNPIHPNYTSSENADHIREKHIKELETEKLERLNKVTDYTYNIMSPFLTDDSLDLLSQNIKLFEVPGSSLTAIETNGSLSTLDIKHYGWNIGEPFTAEISQDSPGRLGIWIGWRIVDSYMRNNEHVTIQELMSEGDAQKILEQSFYKP